MKLYVDAGTTWSKICEISSETSDFFEEYKDFLIEQIENKKFYIIPSNKLKNCNFQFIAATGHMSKNNLKHENNYLNEVISLSKGFLGNISKNGLVLDLGSRDVKWVKFQNGKFKDLDWNNSCASATGATVEMLLKFYDVNVKELEAVDERYNITCGIFGLEKIMDDIANGEQAKIAISKFIHGLAYNAWNFSKKADEIYLSGGFCDNKCFVDSLSKYANVNKLGRFILVDGLINEYEFEEH
ncbi:ATPase [bacterium]|nr:ATPase [bacterium]